MICKQFTVPDALDGATLGASVGKMLPTLADATRRAAFARRDVKLDGQRAPREAPVHAGMTVAVYIRDAEDAPLPEICYEDQHLLMINKPAGISCEADAKGGLTVGELLQSAYPGRYAAPPMPCHRLDNPTDGLLILAKDEATRQLMEKAFRERAVCKRYTCLVRGTPAPAHATLEAYLRKHADVAAVEILDYPAHGALPIRTEYTVLEAGEVSRLLVTLHTGRTHQIRAHLAHIGHPLLGDDKYGDRAFNRQVHARRLMLTATSLDFTLTGELAYVNDLHLSVKPTF